MKNQLIITTGKYQANGGQFTYYPNRFWVSYDNEEKKMELYCGSDEGGGNYYDLKGDYRKEVKQIVHLIGKSSARALVAFFKQNQPK